MEDFSSIKKLLPLLDVPTILAIHKVVYTTWISSDDQDEYLEGVKEIISEELSKELSLATVAHLLKAIELEGSEFIRSGGENESS